MLLSRALLPALAAAALALTACGSDDDGGSTASSASKTSAAASADAAAFPVTLTNEFGKTTIPSEPKRVVTAGFNEADFALALGVTPVAERTVLGSFPYKTRPWKPAGPTPTAIGASEIDLEKVAAARPDVVLGIYSFIDDNVYSKLSKIAPTLAQSKDYPAGGTPWDVQLEQTGKALGREAKAKQVVDSVNAKFAAAREDNADFKGKTITVLFDSGGTKFALNKDDLRSQFFGDLGFTTPAKYSKKTFESSISDEQLSQVDTDVVVVITDKASTLTSSRVYKNLKVVKEGRVVTLDEAGPSAGALGYNSPLSRPYLLDRIVPQLAAAVDGKPDTEVPAES